MKQQTEAKNRFQFKQAHRKRPAYYRIFPRWRAELLEAKECPTSERLETPAASPQACLHAAAASGLRMLLDQGKQAVLGGAHQLINLLPVLPHL